MALSGNMQVLCGDFIAIFWIFEYLQMPIYIWNNLHNTLCLDVEWIFNLSLYIMVYLGFHLLFELIIPKLP